MNTCQQCGKPIRSERSTKKYCSRACKQMAYLKRTDVKQDSTGFTLSDGNLPVNGKTFTSDDGKGNLLPVLYERHPQKTESASNAEDKTYRWIVPDLFIYLEEELSQNTHREYFRRTSYSSGIRILNTKWKSILRHILRLSYRNQVNKKEITDLYRAIRDLQQTCQDIAPDSYPYTNYIRRLAEKCRGIVNTSGRKTIYSIRSPLKEEVLRMLCEIGDTVQDIPFEIQFENLNRGKEK